MPVKQKSAKNNTTSNTCVQSLITNINNEKLVAYNFINFYKHPYINLSGFEITRMPYSTNTLTILSIINSEIIKNLQVFVEQNRKSLQDFSKIPNIDKLIYGLEEVHRTTVCCDLNPEDIVELLNKTVTGFVSYSKSGSLGVQSGGSSGSGGEGESTTKSKKKKKSIKKPSSSNTTPKS